MRLYHFNPSSGELLGEADADESPLEPGVFLVPNHATTILPPLPTEGHARVFRNGAWVSMPDHRGETWWTAARQSVVIDALGEPGDRGLLRAAPSRAVADLQQEKIAAAWSEMQRRVSAGSVSVTTGAGTYSYGLDSVTQDNLQKALLGVLVGISPNPRPWTPKGAAAPIDITHDEVRSIAAAVGLAYEVHVQSYLAHKRAIAALTTTAAVESHDITQGWPA